MKALDRIAEIEKRADAATEGPWEWYGYLSNKDIYLTTPKNGRQIVMGFDRWGMQGAQPKFSVNGIMRSFEPFARRDHNTLLLEIDHPDAAFIAESRDNIPWLTSRLRIAVEALREMQRLRAIDIFDHSVESDIAVEALEKINAQSD